MTDESKKKIKRSVIDSVNKAIATNIGKGDSKTSVSSRQRVVHRDGKTTVVEERIERRDS